MPNGPSVVPDIRWHGKLDMICSSFLMFSASRDDVKNALMSHRRKQPYSGVSWYRTHIFCVHLAGFHGCAVTCKL